MPVSVHAVKCRNVDGKEKMSDRQTVGRTSNMTTTLSTRVLSIAIGAITAYHYETIQTLLPALYTSLISQCLVLAIPPVILLLCYPLIRLLPPILSIIPLLLFPSISIATFPLVDLILLFLVLSLTFFTHPFDTSIAFLISFFSTSVLPRIPSELFASLSNLFINLPPRSHLPCLIFALTCTHLAARSNTIATFAAPPTPSFPRNKSKTKKSARRRRVWNKPLLLVFVFICTLAFATLTSPPLATSVRKAYPRPLPDNYRILEQARGPTGLISVIEVTNKYRMLAADMSILGGYHIKQGYYPDSIFGQFYVHEAVRLTRLPGEPEDTVGGRDGRALCIGVGVGVVAHALHQHSPTVDPVELDPVVARFAKKWFGVKPKIIVADGLKVVADARNETYDFVVHDVFTGGSVPVDLFSVRAFEDIKRVLKKDGVLAVNFVGALDHPPTPATGAPAMVYSRLMRVFGNVRAFSDGLETHNHNIVFFSGVAGAVSFRQATQADWLGSPGREDKFAHLEDHEIGDVLANVDVGDANDWHLYAGMWDITVAHYKIMHTVHPSSLWKSLLSAEKR